MARKFLTLFIALMLCGTARADLFYYSSNSNIIDEDMTYDFGRIIEDGSGKFQKEPALKTGLKMSQQFSTAKYKGHDRLILTDSGSNRISIYNPDNLDTPIVNCELPSLGFTISTFTEFCEPAVWGDNLLLGGSFQNSSVAGIIEVNPTTGEVVNSYMYNHEMSTCKYVFVCGNKIYTHFDYSYTDADKTRIGVYDYAEMSSLGVITNELTGFDWSQAQSNYNRDIVELIYAFDGKLYATYTYIPYEAGREINEIREYGIMRFDSALDTSAGYKIVSFKGEDTFVGLSGGRTLSGTNDEFVIDKYSFASNDNTVEIYLCNGSGSAQKIHTISPYRTSDNTGGTIENSIESMYYDKENGKIFFVLTATRYLLDDLGLNVENSDKLVILSKNSDGSFSVSQEIDGIGRIFFVEPFSGSDSDDNNSNPPSDNNNNPPSNEDNNNPNENPSYEPENPNSNNRNNNVSSSGGGCNTGIGMFASILALSVIAIRKK